MPAKKRTAKRKTVKRTRKATKKATRKPAKKKTEKKLVGKVSHFYNKISVAVVELSDSLAAGDKISVEGSHTNFTQKVDSMQIEHSEVTKAGRGDSIGLKVKDRTREGDKVYRVA